MPLIEFAIEEAALGLAVLRPELRALLEDRDVPSDVQAILGHFEVSQVETFF